MEFTVEALKLLQDTARASESAEHLPELDSVRPLSKHVRIGGEIKQLAIQPPLRCHGVETLLDLINVVKLVGDSQISTIWHNESGVFLCIDDHERRGFASFTLRLSTQFKTLCSLDIHGRGSSTQLQWMDQMQFVEQLRCDLGAEAAVVAPFRALKWEQSASAMGNVESGRDRMGNEVNSEVTGTEKLPTQIEFRVPVYSNYGEEKPHIVTCHVLIELQTRRLTLLPKANSIDRAIHAAQLDIRSRLQAVFGDDDLLHVFYGSM